MPRYGVLLPGMQVRDTTVAATSVNQETTTNSEPYRQCTTTTLPMLSSTMNGNATEKGVPVLPYGAGGRTKPRPSLTTTGVP